MQEIIGQAFEEFGIPLTVGVFALLIFIYDMQSHAHDFSLPVSGPTPGP